MLLYVLAGIGLFSIGLFSFGFDCATISHYTDPWFGISGYSKGVIIEDVGYDYIEDVGCDYIIDMSEEP
uniref:Uncharacterized protein n=1 Tax=Marseillevirus LCMAC101 TaxID=2506602 RepID=A0A481YSC5_9VIRU|nr:MAG: hypothetical protein LCMAC101_07130 [Marseillevirus LCMAC101]